MFILTSRTAPLAAVTAFSMIGDSVLQGPHHGAQKSTSTGWRRDSSRTSLAKAWVVVSLMRSAALAPFGRPWPRRAAQIGHGHAHGLIRFWPAHARRERQSPREIWSAAAVFTIRRHCAGDRRRSAARGRWRGGRRAGRPAAMVVVAVLTSGWQLTAVSRRSAPSSRTTVTRPRGVVDRARRR